MPPSDRRTTVHVPAGEGETLHLDRFSRSLVDDWVIESHPAGPTPSDALHALLVRVLPVERRAARPWTIWADLSARFDGRCGPLLDSVLADHELVVGTDSTGAPDLRFMALRPTGSVETFLESLHDALAVESRSASPASTTRETLHGFGSGLRWTSLPFGPHGVDGAPTVESLPIGFDDGGRVETSDGGRPVRGDQDRTRTFDDGFLVRKQRGLTIERFGGYETRIDSTVHLIHLAVACHRLPDFDWVYVRTADRPPPATVGGVRALGYSYDAYGDDAGRVADTCPDFLFDHWSQTGVDDYEQTRAAIRAAGAAPPTSDVLGWRGASTGENRERLIAHSGAPGFDVERIEWVRTDPDHLRAAHFLSLEEQIRRWRFVIDIEGVGYSARTKLLLGSGRVLFLVDRPYHEWFYPNLVPWTHHVPVSRDLSDLDAHLERVRSEPDLEEHLVHEAQTFADRHLTRAAALHRWRDLLT